MSRPARLLRLMNVLRRVPPPVTAARLAAETGVSLRTLYRDIATLRAGGALIDGEAGVGYTLTEDPALPPQNFSRLEIEALVLAVSALRALGDEELTQAAESALSRMIATLPDRVAHQAMHRGLRLFLPQKTRPVTSVDPALIRQAIWDEAALYIEYEDLKGQRSRREIWPLGMAYSDAHLTLLGWCLLRQDFRLFHVPKISRAERTGASFRPHRARLLQDYIKTRA